MNSGGDMIKSNKIKSRHDGPLNLRWVRIKPRKSKGRKSLGCLRFELSTPLELIKCVAKSINMQLRTTENFYDDQLGTPWKGIKSDDIKILR